MSQRSLSLSLVAAALLIFAGCDSGGSTPEMYEVTTSASPSEGGEVVLQGNGEYEEGTEVEVRAEPSEGWRFAGWEGDLGGSENPATITVDSEKSVTAAFERKDYTLTVETEGEGSVSESVVQEASAQGDYPSGTTVELTAEPAAEWKFVEWRGDLSGQENPVTITVDEAKSVTAVFERKDYALTVETEGEGTVSEEIVQQAATQSDYPSGTTVQLTAEPSEGWQFVEWQGNLSGSENPATIVVDEAKSVTAVFERKEYALKVGTQGEGNVNEELVSGDRGEEGYLFGAEVRLTAEAAEDWTFDHWEGDFQGTDSSQVTTVTIDGEKSVTAVFERKDYTLTVETEGEGTVSEEVVQQAAATQTDYPSSTTVQLTAEPSEGWQFVEWQGALSGSENPTTVTVDEPKSVTAVFEREEYALTVNTEGEGSISEELISGDSGENGYLFESEVRLTAQASDGWTFDHWEGDLQGTEASKTITIDGDKSATAVFVRTYAVSVGTEGSGSISTDPQMERYPAGTEVEFTAVPETGWKFVRWEGDLSGSASPQSLTIDSDKSVTAVFEEEQYEISASVEGNGSVERSPQKVTYTYGEEVQFTATADEGSAFIEWSGALSGGENPQTLTVTGDASVTAVFQTYDEALTFQRTGGVFIGGRVHQASLALFNGLPEAVDLNRFVLKDENGNVVTENTEGATIAPGEGVGISISFGIAPTEETFSNYTTEWHVEYNGDTYTKVAEVGGSSNPFQATQSAAETLEVEIKGNR